MNQKGCQFIVDCGLQPLPFNHIVQFTELIISYKNAFENGYT